MNSEQQPFEQPSESNPFREMQDDEFRRQLAIKMQQNFKDPEDTNNCLNSHLEHFVGVASNIIAVEKALGTNCSDVELAKTRRIINSHFPVPASESIILEDLSDDSTRS